VTHATTRSTPASTTAVQEHSPAQLIPLEDVPPGIITAVSATSAVAIPVDATRMGVSDQSTIRRLEHVLTSLRRGQERCVPGWAVPGVLMRIGQSIAEEGVLACVFISDGLAAAH
jgi:hypothetical protein